MIANAQVRGSREGGVTTTTNTNQGGVNNNNQNTGTGGESLIIVFFIVFIIWMAVSAALVYHWRKYGKGDSRISLAQSVYFASSLLILVVALFSLS
jgi:cytochrome b subunit of formate dehydrogenase